MALVADRRDSLCRSGFATVIVGDRPDSLCHSDSDWGEHYAVLDFVLEVFGWDRSLAKRLPDRDS